MHFWFGKKEEEPQKAAAEPAAQPAAAPPSPSRAGQAAAPSPAPAEPPSSSCAERASAPAPAPAPAGASPSVVLRPVKPVASVGPDGKAAVHTVGVAAPSAKVRARPDSRALYAQLMNGIYDAVLVLDDRGRTIDCNGRVLNILGYTRDEAWDLPVSAVIPGMTQAMLDKLKAGLATSHHAIISTRCFRKDGTYFSGEVGVCLCQLMRGSSFVMTIRSTTSREKADEEIRMVHAAFLASPVVQFICAQNGNFTSVNPAFLAFFRMSDAGQAKAATLPDLLPEAAGGFLKAASGIRSIETIELPQAAEGEPCSITVAVVPLLRGQDVIAVSGSITVLKRKQAEEVK